MRPAFAKDDDGCPIGTKAVRNRHEGGAQSARRRCAIGTKA
eukprot:gene4613-2739_t